MASSKPRSCYAAEVSPCVGGLSDEHFISRALLDKFGASFIVDGAPWSKDPISVGPKSFQSRILCREHNSQLSELDAELVKLYDYLDAFRRGEFTIGAIDGNLIERWVIKLISGLSTSGNLPGSEREKVAIPVEPWLQALFGTVPLEPGSGFHALLDRPIAANGAVISFAALQYPDTAPEAGAIYGGAIDLLGMQFAVTVTLSNPNFKDSHAVHRPIGYVLNDQGYLAFGWTPPPTSPQEVRLSWGQQTQR